MKKKSRIYLFMAEKIMDPEDDISYDSQDVIDSNDNIESGEELMDFIHSSLHDLEADEVCFLLKESRRDRVIDCGLGSKFAAQTENDNSFEKYFAYR